MRTCGRLLLVVAGVGTTSMIGACETRVASSIFLHEIIVRVETSGSGRGSVRNVTQPVNQKSGTPFRIDCQHTPGGSASGWCQDDFRDAGGIGTMVLEATPAGGSRVTRLGLGCRETTGTRCTLEFGPGFGTILTGHFTFDVVGQSSMLIEDDFETPRTWRSVVESANGPVSDSVATNPTGGNPAGFRYMRHRLQGAGNIVVRHWFDEQTYDPSTDGAIASLTFAEDRVVIAPAFSGAAVGASFLIEQDGQVFTLGLGSFADTGWTGIARTGLTPVDFIPAPGPDFSSAGGTLTFGFGRSNTNTGGGDWVSQHGVDNFRVEISR